MHTFFAGECLAGPYAKVRYQGKSKLFADLAKRHYDQVLVAKAASGQGSVAQQVKRDFAQADKEEKRENMSETSRGLLRRKRWRTSGSGAS